MFLVGAPKMNSAGCGTGQFVLYDGSQAPPFMPQSTPTNFGSASNLFGTSVAYLGSQFILLGPHWYAVADPAATGGGLVWTFN